MTYPFCMRSREPRRPEKLLCAVFLLILTSHITFAQVQWPEIEPTNRPWTRWWWMGSAVEDSALTQRMEEYRAAGLGGVEITPIYGVAGYESQFIDYLSEDWVDRLRYTLREAERIGLGVDMATGTGWPFGGPWVGEEDASKYLAHRTYTLSGGETLSAAVEYRQEPVVRAVGYNVYGVEQSPVPDEAHERATLSEIQDPIARNENLQVLALDQVRFEKPLPLLALMAYSDRGEHQNLTSKVDDQGTLHWTAPEGQWTLYALFQGWHGKMVERAAPGGEGNVIDHFSATALQHYLSRFDEALTGQDIGSLRSFFNDSYEVDDARGQANWTPELLTEFEQRRGYDLREHLPALLGDADEEVSERVLSDYRETISELLLEKFTQPWQQWAQDQGAIIRNQSHGSPANILDLYGASDIPETEGNDILRFKFATSAAHVTGKPLVSAESATWLNEHFTSTLGDVREAVDLFFLGGVNHIFYHGTNYSPPEEEWPGWLFYAAVHFSPSNSWWKDFGALNAYVARCQSFLQSGQSDNNVLLYFPIYDYYAERTAELLRHFDGFEEGDESPFHESTVRLQERGYGYDFVSDRQLEEIEVSGPQLLTGNTEYQTLVLPDCRFIPAESWDKLISLVEAGTTLIVHRNLPESLPGLRPDTEQQAFSQNKERLQFSSTQENGVQEALLGEGRILMGDDLESLLAYAGVRREAMVDEGLQFVRRRSEGGHTYLIVNHGEETIDGWVPLSVSASSAALYDPMQQRSGLAALRVGDERSTEIYLQIPPGESRIVRTDESTSAGDLYGYYQAVGEAMELEGTWSLSFVEGGPTLPADEELTALGSWTDLDGEEVKKFSGTARYTLRFPRPEGDASAWRLNLGEVHESAVVRLNGEVVGTLIGPNYSLDLDNDQLEANNTLEIAVSNRMANRIADLDQREVAWKKFYNINFPSRLPENRGDHGLFTAAPWKPQPSGLSGPVTLTPLKPVDF